MPIHRAALKRVRSDQRRRARNDQVRSELRTRMKRVTQLLNAGVTPDTLTAVRALVKRWDQAHALGVLPHRRTASRKIGRLLRRVHRVSTTRPAPAAEPPRPA